MKGQGAEDEIIVKRNDPAEADKDLLPASFFMRNCRDCQFKKCCKKYKRGKRCGKCPKK